MSEHSPVWIGVALGARIVLLVSSIGLAWLGLYLGGAVGTYLIVAAAVVLFTWVVVHFRTRAIFKRMARDGRPQPGDGEK